MKGFTLLEVMIALAIMSGVLLTVISSFNYHLSLVTRDKEDTTVLLLARAKLEELELLKKDVSQGSESGDFAPDRQDVSWKMEIAPTSVLAFKKMTLTLTWEKGRRTLSLVHYLAQ